MKGVSQTSLRYSEGRVVRNTKHKSLEKFPILHTKAQLDNGQIGRARSRQQGEYSIAENDATTRCPQRSGTSGGSSFGITCGVFSFAFFSGGAADCGGLASRTRQVPLEDPSMEDDRRDWNTAFLLRRPLSTVLFGLAQIAFCTVVISYLDFLSKRSGTCGHVSK